MAAYIDYDFYANVYLGDAIAPGDFPRLAERASAYVRAVTRGRSETVSGQEDREAVQRAACAVAEALQDESRMQKLGCPAEPAVSSETVGSWSRSYQSAAFSAAQAEDLRRRKREALEVYLGAAPAFAEMFGVRGYRCRGRR